MALVRAFTKVDENNKISLPSNIQNELKLARGQLMELKIRGTKDAPYLVVYKRKNVR